jgi:hypothetical protein
MVCILVVRISRAFHMSRVKSVLATGSSCAIAYFGKRTWGFQRIVTLSAPSVISRQNTP